MLFFLLAFVAAVNSQQEEGEVSPNSLLKKKNLLLYHQVSQCSHIVLDSKCHFYKIVTTKLAV